MKRITLLLLLFLANHYFGQNSFEKIKNELMKNHPEVLLDNKIIIVNYWSVNDQSNKEANLELNKTVTVFEHAKLKGGKKGVIGVIVCSDSNKTGVEVSLNKGNLLKPYLLGGDFSESVNKNIVYDAEGNIVYKNLSASELFDSIQQLITR